MMNMIKDIQNQLNEDAQLLEALENELLAIEQEPAKKSLFNLADVLDESLGAEQRAADFGAARGMMNQPREVYMVLRSGQKRMGTLDPEYRAIIFRDAKGNKVKTIILKADADFEKDEFTLQDVDVRATQQEAA